MQKRLTKVLEAGSNLIVEGDNKTLLEALPLQSFGLIYMDPPFNTGKKQERKTLRTVADVAGDRIGFGDKRYRSEQVGSRGYADSFDDFLAFLMPRIERCRELLDEQGSLYLHLDSREVHYVKVALDHLFGRDCFLNEIIWAYDFGGRPKNRWPAKHDTILLYVRNRKRYHFDLEAVERIPYMAPGLVGKVKAARGKSPTDVWWHTIVATNGKEKTGYPSQKPLGVLKRVIAASAVPGLPVLDPFAGSGTTGEAAALYDRQFVLCDSNPEAVEIMSRRLAKYNPVVIKNSS